MRDATVLVVEDDRDIRDILREVLVMAGYGVHDVGNGDTALAVLRRTIPDVILLDLWMPGMSSEVFIKILADKYPTIPLIVCTGNRNHADLPSHVRAVLYKPFALGMLEDTVSSVLRAPVSTTRMLSSMMF